MGIPTLISTHTASDSSSIDITSGIDSTYDEYMFVFTDMHPETDQQKLLFQVNASGQSGFNETMTTTSFIAYHLVDGSATSLGYRTGADQAEGTDYQKLTEEIGTSSNSSSTAGILHLFNPASTTYVKHFYARSSDENMENTANSSHTAGYINVTAAIDEISFKFASGNMNGTIQMYGIA